MKKNLIHILITLLALFIADGLTSAYLDKKYEANTCDYSNGYINDYLKNKDADTLFIGSSRVLHGIRPEFFGPKTFVLAKQQKHLYYNASLIDILKDENKLPHNTLILNIEVEDMFLHFEDRMIDDVSSLKYYYNTNALTTELIKRNRVFEPLKFTSSLYRHNNSGWKLLFSPKAGECASSPFDGYKPLMPSKNDSIRLARSIIEDLKPFGVRQLNPKTFELIERIKVLCQKQNIDFYIINAPFFEMNAELKDASIILSNYCASSEIKFIDFNFTTIDALNSKKYWYDNMHLNHSGAEIYSKKIKELLH